MIHTPLKERKGNDCVPDFVEIAKDIQANRNSPLSQTACTKCLNNLNDSNKDILACCNSYNCMWE